MKTNNTQTRKISELRVQSSNHQGNLPGTDQTENRPRIDFAQREANRELPTQTLLALLQTEAPRFYELAQIVGKWIWIEFPDKQPPQITSQLAQFGFHWNSKRQVWQHPCGVPMTEGSPDDPRQKYGTFFPSDEYGPHAPA